VALGPNQVWSWDITNLRGPKKGEWYKLYVIIDIFSRKVVAWLLAPNESAELAKAMFEQAYKNEGVGPTS
jgi:putative transposase